jgi:hypothetical protein
MIQTCHLKKIKAATRNEQFFVFSSPAVDPNQTVEWIILSKIMYTEKVGKY